nr:T9SS type A sorting domain-containing protein [Bacteroidota bacterium]
MKRALLSLILILTVIFISAQIRIDTPAQSAPGNGDEDQMPNVKLDWDAVISATQYRAQLSTVADFSDIILDSTTMYTAVACSYLHFNMEYFWRVKAIDANENESFWSPAWSFVTFNQVALNKPNNGADEQDVNELLSWRNKVGSIFISGVERFNLQLDLDENFTSPAAILFTVAGNVYSKDMDKLLFGTTYYWRVRAFHSMDTSAWSDTRNFVTLDFFDLSKPNNNSVDQDLNVQLRWDNVEGIDKYDYQIGADPDFIITTTYVTDTFRVFPEDLKYGITYYWRARARHDFDTTQWSEPYNFMTAAAVLLENPLNEEDSLGLKPKLEWSQIKGTTTYEVEYADNADFIDSFVDYPEASDDDNPEYNVLYALTLGTQYYWRIRACNSYDTSDYSEVWSFTTFPPVGINDDFFAEAGIHLYPNPVKDYLRIELNLEESSAIEITLMDLIGNAIVEEEVVFSSGSDHTTIDVSTMASGLYLIKLKKDHNIFTKKLIINK